MLYFNDGQNVFDEKTAYVGEDWQADEALEALSKEGIEAIAVAIPNGMQERMDEYNPWRETATWKSCRSGPSEMGGKGDAYLDWVIGYRHAADRPVLPDGSPDRRTRRIIGSSMGGLISLYALPRGRRRSALPAL